ncbi:extracellular solute-binding protein [Evansella cellulosilytica]|uniref:Extracellular solute-binding protein family 1 n=1 Tax=Evansella cellulosilytica (strain ATCC 21833 / DSM 2522 / FERM P-1141 / JCM 9156 / N-4) TaxID=649639 RepID=E6U0H0_EVAC2|nr:extracellular solute-binding protein [Evansella cellulosilytica]ADU31415.1 extracellular solute-binding protein family 1 [Evansella cellulosilytica DSM 2522]
MFDKWKKLLFFGAVVGLLSLMVACGDEGSSGESNENENGEDDATPDSGEVVELTFWASSNPDRADFQYTMERVEQFNDEHSDIQINIETTAHADYRTRLNTQAAGGQLPDIFQVWPGAELEPLVEGNAVKSLNEIKGNWTDSGLVDEEVLQDFTFDGETYAIPSVQNPTSFVFYDVDMLADVGYDEFPATYDELLELIEALNNEGITPIALGNSAAWPLQSVYISTIADRFTGPDFLSQVFAGERKFTDDDFVQALGVIEELYQVGAFNEDLNTMDDNQMLEYFLQGRSAMVLDGNWGVINILTDKPEDKNVGIAIFPLGDTNSVSTVAGNSWSINADLEGEELEAAHTFMKWMFSEEFYQGLANVGRVVAADVDLPEDSEHDQLFIDMLELASSAPPAPVYDATLPQAVNNVLQNELQAITIGRSTPEESAEKIQQAVENE